MRSCALRHLVERHLTHTVDGIVGIVHLIGHTVLGTMQYDTATKHTAEVGTLHGIHHTSRRDGTHTLDSPQVIHRLALCGNVRGHHGLIGSLGQVRVIIIGMLHTVNRGELHQCCSHVFATTDCPLGLHLFLLHGQPSIHHLAIGVVVNLVTLVDILIINSIVRKDDFLLLILQFIDERIVVLLQVGELKVLLIGQLLREVIVVGTIVGDIELAVSIHEGKVTITIETTHMVATETHKVLGKHVDDSSRSVTIYGHRIGIHEVGTRGHVTTCKDGIANGDSHLVELSPYFGVTILQLIKVLGEHILTLLVGLAPHGHILQCTATSSDVYAAVLSTFMAFVNVVCRRIGAMIVMSIYQVTIGLSRILQSWAVDITDVTATKHVTLTLGNRLFGSDSTAIDLHVGVSEHVSVGVLTRSLVGRVLARVCISIGISATATEHVTLDQSAIDAHLGITRNVHLGTFLIRGYHALTYGSNLTTAIDTVSHNTSIEVDQRIDDHRALTVSCTIEVTFVLKLTHGNVRIEVEHGVIVSYRCSRLSDACIFVADVAVVHLHYSRIADKGALATTIDVTLDGRHTIVEREWLICTATTRSQ